MTDEQYLSELSKVKIYCEVLLGVLRYIPVKRSNSEQEIKESINKNLKFENNDSHLRLRACIDLTEDTQFAIDEFFENGLKTNEDFFGEKYLRLYGVLNAAYLQMQSIIELIELFKIPDKKKIIKELNSQKIIEIRNKIGAHTPKYENKNSNFKNRYEAYRLTQVSITKWGDELVLVSSYDEIEKYNLPPLLKQFTGRIEYYLDLICDKSLNSLFKDESEHKEWMTNRLNFARKK